MAIALHNLASLYETRAEYEQAHAQYELALVAMKKTFGEKHTNVANTLNSLTALEPYLAKL